MSIVKSYQTLSMNKKILLSISFGVLIGLFFGDRCQVLNGVNQAFIAALQITIIPYLFFSLIRSIGSLSTDTAKKAAKSCLCILLLLWLISAVFAWLLPYSFPAIDRETFYVPNLDKSTSSFNLVDVFIPSNPFNSLAQGYIPAVVLFCFLFGMALINAKDKHETLSALDKIVVALKKCNDYIMTIMPIGLLLISAYTAGVSSPGGVQEVLVYITASMVYNAIFTLLILPAAAVVFTKLTYRQILSAAAPALLLSFASGNSFMSLPLAYQGIYSLDKELAKTALNQNITERRQHIDVFVPLAYIVPSSYKFLVIFFVMFGGWFFDIVIPATKELSLFLVGIPCLFGSNVLVVPFLLQLADIPSQAFNIFYLSSNVLVFFNNANNTMFIVVIVLLWCAALNRELHFSSRKFVLYGVLSIAIFAISCSGIYYGFNKVILANESKTAGIFAADFPNSDRPRFMHIQAVLEPRPDAIRNIAPRDPNIDRLQQVINSRELRVGYLEGKAPFAFINTSGKLVGLDVNLMYNLAEMMGSDKIIFIPLSKLTVPEINDGQLDIAIGGISDDDTRLQKFKMSVPYVTLHTAMMFPIKFGNHYSDIDQVIDAINANRSISVAARKVSPFIHPLKSLYPNHKIVAIDDNLDEYFKDHIADVLVISAEEAYTQRTLHPGYEVMSLTDDSTQMPCSFPMPAGTINEGWREFVDQWITGKRINGYLNRNYDYWISGIGLEQKKARWSILDEIEQRLYPKRTSATFQ